MTTFWMTGFVLVALIAIGVVIRRSRPVPTPVDAAWVEHFSADRYKPMERLLREQDYEFLATQPGYTPLIARNLRSQRKRILKSYLRSLCIDFDRLYRAGFEIALMSPSERDDLLIILARQRAAFRLAVWRVRFSLALAGLGFNVAGVSDAIQPLRTLAVEMRKIQPARC